MYVTGQCPPKYDFHLKNANRKDNFQILIFSFLKQAFKWIPFIGMLLFWIPPFRTCVSLGQFGRPRALATNWQKLWIQKICTELILKVWRYIFSCRSIQLLEYPIPAPAPVIKRKENEKMIKMWTSLFSESDAVLAHKWKVWYIAFAWRHIFLPHISTNSKTTVHLRYFLFLIFRDSTANFLQIVFKHCLNLWYKHTSFKFC